MKQLPNTTVVIFPPEKRKNIIMAQKLKRAVLVTTVNELPSTLVVIFLPGKREEITEIDQTQTDSRTPSRCHGGKSGPATGHAHASKTRIGLSRHAERPNRWRRRDPHQECTAEETNNAPS